ncbi:MAG: glycosyltransferase family 39 protein [Hyphomicrobiales bacterium]
MTSVGASAPDKIAPRAAPVAWRWGLWCVVSVGLAYGLIYTGMRLALSLNLPQDNVTANILAQTLEPGYVSRQPPLYEWLLWTVQRFTGPNLLSFLLIKYALLTATFVFLYLAARRMFKDERWATVAALSPLLLYQIGWNMHEGVTQTSVLMCAVAASLWALMRLAERGAIGDYLLFGLVAGIGILSKHSYWGFLLILLVSAALQPALRVRLFDRRLGLAVAVCALITAPYFYWLVNEGRDLVAVYDTAVAPEQTNRLQATLMGLGLSIYAPLAFLFPLDVILLVCFPRMVFQGRDAIRQAIRPREWTGSEPDWRLLLSHVTIGGFLLLIVGALSTGATHYLERYMHPFFLLTALWLVALVEGSGNPGFKVKVLGATILAITMAVVPLRALDLVNSMGHECHKCRLGVPFEELAEALRARGIGSGTIMAANRHDAGNLRRLFPDARIVCLRNPAYGPRVRVADLKEVSVVVWRPSDGARLPKGAKAELAKIKAKAGSPERLHIPWLATGSPPKVRDWEWTIVVAAPARHD